MVKYKFFTGYPGEMEQKVNQWRSSYPGISVIHESFHATEHILALMIKYWEIVPQDNIATGIGTRLDVKL
jgi:cephalosporin hydroxylase